jgi:hypothetical protein
MVRNFAAMWKKGVRKEDEADPNLAVTGRAGSPLTPQRRDMMLSTAKL